MNRDYFEISRKRPGDAALIHANAGLSLNWKRQFNASRAGLDQTLWSNNIGKGVCAPSCFALVQLTDLEAASACFTHFEQAPGLNLRNQENVLERQVRNRRTQHVEMLE